jgi:hypothetical protein
MRRFERTNDIKTYDDKIISKYDVPTVFSEYGQCSLHDSKLTFSAFKEKVHSKGIDVEKYSTIVRRSYDDITSMDENGDEAVQSVMRNVTWRESAMATTFKPHTFQMTYERRENGYQDESVEDQSIRRIIG